MKRKFLKLLRFFLIVLLFVTVVAVLGFSYCSAYLLTHPWRVPITRSPADYGLKYEEVDFKSPDGLVLSGWYIPSSNGAVIILCHGLFDNRTGMLDEAAMLSKHGYGALLFDFRAHGESMGEVTTYGYKEAEDIIGALAFLRNERGVERIGVLGMSMGAAAAIRAAALSPEIKAVVAVSPYADFGEVARGWIPAKVPYFPFGFLIIKFGEWQIGVKLSDIKPIDDVASVSPRPVFIIHGLDDDVVPSEHASRLHNAALEPKDLWLIPSAGHIISIQTEGFEERVINFLDEALLKGWISPRYRPSLFDSQSKP
jgi:fermentation-respiration switch protein FrsA (DUF1100 family)